MDSRSQGRSRSGTMRSNSERVKHGSLERARPQIDRKRSKDDSDLDFERNDEDFSRRRSRRRDDEPRNHPQPRDISARAQDRIRNRELQRSLNRSETDELFRQELRQRDGGSRSETSRETDPPSSDDIVTEAARRKDLRSRGGSSEDDAHKPRVNSLSDDAKIRLRSGGKGRTSRNRHDESSPLDMMEGHVRMGITNHAFDDTEFDSGISSVSRANRE
ncbi:unnamed protein product, partial [Cyprideis torosa]